VSDNRGVSHLSVKKAIGCNRGEFAKIDVFAMRFCSIIEDVPYHVSHLINDERRASGKGHGALASIRSKLMLTCITFCHCTTKQASQTPPILRIAGDISTSGGQS
jgi:hypothetical protein